MARTEAVTSVALNTLSRVSGRLAGARTFALFQSPMVRSAARDTERELFDAAHQERITVRGQSIATYRWGDGERPVLLVHGWQSRASRLAGFVAALRERGHSVVTFDLAGHGESGGERSTILDYRDTITALHKHHGPFTALVAHSIGALGSLYALTHGVRAERVVVLSGVCDFTYIVDEFSTALKLRPRLKARLYDEIGRRLFPDVPADRMPFSATHAVERTTAPLLVIHDEDDTRIAPSQGRRIAEAFGERARLVTTSGLGHRRILGDAEVIHTVVDFVAHGPSQPEPAHGSRHRAP